MQGDKLMQKSTDVIMQRRLLISINLSEMYETKKSSVFFLGGFFWFVCCFFFFFEVCFVSTCALQSTCRIEYLRVGKHLGPHNYDLKNILLHATIYNFSDFFCVRFFFLFFFHYFHNQLHKRRRQTPDRLTFGSI